MDATKVNAMDRPRVIMAGVVISAMGAMFYNLLPLFLGVAQDYRGLDNQAIGLLSSTFFVGYTVTTTSAFFWIRKLDWRLVTWLALPLGAAALLLGGYTDSHAILLLSVFVAGGAFSALYGIGTTALGDTTMPARWYGLKISAEAMLGAVLLFLLPGTLIARFGFTGLMLGMALAAALLAPLLLFLPPQGNKEPRTDDQMHAVLPRGLLPALWLALLGVTAFIFSATMLWAFVERMASEAGFEPVATGQVLSLTLLFAVLGSTLAVLLGDRYGLGKPLTGASLSFVLSLLVLSGTSSLAQFATGACLLTFAIGLGITYSVTVVAKLDLDGRYVVLSVPAIGVGVMLAPAVGGFLSVSGSYGPVFVAGAITISVSLAAALWALKMGLPLLTLKDNAQSASLS